MPETGAIREAAGNSKGCPYIILKQVYQAAKKGSTMAAFARGNTYAQIVRIFFQYNRHVSQREPLAQAVYSLLLEAVEISLKWVLRCHAERSRSATAGLTTRFDPAQRDTCSSETTFIDSLLELRYFLQHSIPFQQRQVLVTALHVEVLIIAEIRVALHGTRVIGHRQTRSGGDIGFPFW